MALILIGDIGGTTMRFQLIRSTPSEDTIIKSQDIIALDFDKNIISAIAYFLESQQIPEIAVIGMCGVIKNNALDSCVAYKISFSGAEVSEKFNIPKVILLNDLESAGYGLISLSPTEYKEINHGQPDPTGNKVCIGIGTNIGQCFITHNENSYKVFPTEGGFQDYCPKSKNEKKLYNFICEKYQTAGISYNSVLAGTHINNIYEFLREEHKEIIDQGFDSNYMEQESEQARIVMQAGFGLSNKLAEMAVGIWQRVLGNLLGNVFVNFMPTGGIYVFGGVISKNFEGIIRGKKVKEGFYCGRPNVLHGIMKEAPIYVVGVEDVGLRGALFYAKREVFRI